LLSVLYFYHNLNSNCFFHATKRNNVLLTAHSMACFIDSEIIYFVTEHLTAQLLIKTIYCKSGFGINMVS